MPNFLTQVPAISALSSSFFGLAKITLSLMLLSICQTSLGWASVMYTARNAT